MILTKKVAGIFYLLKAGIFTLFVGSFLIAAATSGSLPDNPTERPNAKKGMASYYANSFVGRKTANGEIFSQEKLTCASNVYPLGTWLKVTNLRNGKSVIVKVNDRMHPKMNRVVDLSRLAAQELNMIKSGVAQVQVESLGKVLPKAP
jgi:rare lipoprotein A